MNILIFSEQEKGVLKPYSEELASKAARLATSTGGEVTALAFGAGASACGSLGAFGVKEVIAVEGAGFEQYIGEAYAFAALQAAKKVNPQIILASATSVGKDLLPRLAFKLKAGLATDCVALEITDGKLLAKRPVFAGKALVTVCFQSAVQLATARPNSFPVEKRQGGTARVTSLDIRPPSLRVKIKKIEKEEQGTVDLGEADVVVSGGRAVGSREGFAPVQELAKVLGAAVGASRAAVDAGYIGHDHQVGQTGRTVNPKLYIACGISGAIQHWAGMQTAKVIVAINKDPEAPIFSKSDYGIVGDLFVLLPILTRKFKELLGR